MFELASRSSVGAYRKQRGTPCVRHHLWKCPVSSWRRAGPRAWTQREESSGPGGTPAGFHQAGGDPDSGGKHGPSERSWCLSLIGPSEESSARKY